MSDEQEFYKVGVVWVSSLRSMERPETLLFIVKPDNSSLHNRYFLGTTKGRKWYNWFLFFAGSFYRWRNIDEAAEAACREANRIAGIARETELQAEKVARRMQQREHVLHNLEERSSSHPPHHTDV